MTNAVRASFRLGLLCGQRDRAGYALSLGQAPGAEFDRAAYDRGLALGRRIAGQALVHWLTPSPRVRRCRPGQWRILRARQPA